MPWQRLVADVALEQLEDGRPAFREIVVTVPRQNGKSILLLAVMIQRALGWDSVQKIAYSAQTGNDARKKLVEDWYPILQSRKAKLGIARILTGMGNESIPFVNGSRIVLLASDEASGHGKTLDMAMHDELFADRDNRRIGSTTPAMRTRRRAQTWFTSTMGTDASLALNAKVELGRASVERGKRTGTAYFEWSADEAADIDDPAVWWACNPALGFTIDEDVVRHDRESMPEGDFRRYDLNQRTSTDERVIPVAVWRAVQFDQADPSGSVVFGFDVSPNRSSSAIVVAGGGSVKLVDHRDGVGWAIDRLVELGQKWKAPVVLDVSGPAGPFRRELTDKGIEVVEVAGRSFTQACGAFFDAVADGQLRVEWHADLDAAVAGAAKRQSGDAWAWARKSSDVDITPLVAATVAYWAAGANEQPPQVFAY